MELALSKSWLAFHDADRVSVHAALLVEGAVDTLSRLRQQSESEPLFLASFLRKIWRHQHLE
jgi:hypothetical protein